MFTFQPEITDDIVKQSEGDYKRFRDELADTMLDVGSDVENTFLPRLSEYPKTRAVHPFVWSHNPAANARARRKYFWLVNKGLVETDSYGYVRNGGYARSWIFDINITDETLTLTLFNTFPARKWVGGDSQIPGHAKTGWIQYKETIADMLMYTDAEFRVRTKKKNA